MRSLRLILSALALAQLTAAGPAFAAGGGGDFSATPDRSFADAPTLVAEAAEVLAKVLAASDLRRVTVLDADRTAALNAHAAFVGFDNVIGTLTVVPGEQEVLLKAMPFVMKQRAQAQCNGAFSSGRIPDAAGNAVSRLVTTCRSGASAPVTATWLAAPRKKGGIFIFGIVAFGSEAAAKATDASIRDAVMKALAVE